MPTTFHEWLACAAILVFASVVVWMHRPIRSRAMPRGIDMSRFRVVNAPDPCEWAGEPRLVPEAERRFQPDYEHMRKVDSQAWVPRAHIRGWMPLPKPTPEPRRVGDRQYFAGRYEGCGHYHPRRDQDTGQIDSDDL